MSTANSDDSSDKNVEIWKVKKLIKSLQMARGNGTSMISLIIPPGDQVRVLVLTLTVVNVTNSHFLKIDLWYVINACPSPGQSREQDVGR